MNKLWRTLVRITSIDEENKCFYVVIPGWSVKEKAKINFSEISFPIHIGKRMHVMVNIGAKRIEDLCFESWESE